MLCMTPDCKQPIVKIRYRGPDGGIVKEVCQNSNVCFKNTIRY